MANSNGPNWVVLGVGVITAGVAAWAVFLAATLADDSRHIASWPTWIALAVLVVGAGIVVWGFVDTRRGRPGDLSVGKREGSDARRAERGDVGDVSGNAVLATGRSGATVIGDVTVTPATPPPFDSPRPPATPRD